MRKLVFFWIMALVYLVCSSRSCTEESQTNDPRQLERIRILQDSVIGDFTQAELSGPDRSYFEMAGMQKFRDWADYTRIKNNTSFDPVFREHARQIARSMFITEEWADKMDSSAIPVRPFSLDSVALEGRLARTGDHQYTGLLSYLLIRQDSAGSKSMKIHGKLPFCTIRTDKVFGTDTLKVWGVFLGDDD